MTNPEFRPVARQNPSVLQPPEMVCSARKHPLSSVSGRRRYNTLDFPTENRVPTGRFHPYWKPRSKGTSSPFTIPARLRICTHKLIKRFCKHRSINAKNPQRLALITQHNIKTPSKRSFFFLWNIKPLCHPKSAGYYNPEKLTETTSGLRTANKFAIYKKGGSATSLLLSYDVQTNNNLVDYPMETVFCPNQFCSTVLQRTTIRFCPPLVQVNSVRGWSEGSASPSVLCR